jgi:cobalt/nickel transport system permease protein
MRLAILIFIKAIAIVSTTYAIFGSARFDISMIAIQRLKCPKIIIQMILFTYRFVFLFLDEMKRMDTAMRARGFIMKIDLNTLRIIGNFVGTLLVRSFERATRVYNAMLSKGYKGEFHTLESFEVRRKDFIKAAMVLVATFALLVGDICGPFSPAIERWF